jgi:predicted lipoprotein with Yx(FWY)xxD motif
MHFFSKIIGFVAISFAALSAPAGAESAAKSTPLDVEDYLRVPLPPGFSIQPTELEGMVFADRQGRTLYHWPMFELRSGYSGNPLGKSTCENQRITTSAALAGLFPPGLIMPEVETRPSCTDMWPPALASDDDVPVGKWSIITRKDGRKQWAFDNAALYTSRFDTAPGDVLGGAARNSDITDSPALRYPVGPPPNLPPGFAIVSTVNGRLLMTDTHRSVYTFDKDVPGKSNCDADCIRTWTPVMAPVFARDQGDWSLVERAPGVKQWAFRKKPLYTSVLDRNPGSLEGSDIPGWSNVYTVPAPRRPNGFTVQDTDSGQVLADSRGMTIYRFQCTDDAMDQLACDHPDMTQVYRFAICGAGDMARCLKTFPYVEAAADAKSDSRTWSIMSIDPATGHRAAAGQSGAVRVWAYRDRPVFTYAGDRGPGEARGDSIGEFGGDRYGFKAFWVRDDFFLIVGR